MSQGSIPRPIMSKRCKGIELISKWQKGLVRVTGQPIPECSNYQCDGWSIGAKVTSKWLRCIHRFALLENTTLTHQDTFDKMIKSSSCLYFPFLNNAICPDQGLICGPPPLSWSEPQSSPQWSEVFPPGLFRHWQWTTSNLYWWIKPVCALLKTCC